MMSVHHQGLASHGATLTGTTLDLFAAIAQETSGPSGAGPTQAPVAFPLFLVNGKNQSSIKATYVNQKERILEPT